MMHCRLWIVLLVLGGLRAEATTWYVRSDGGTRYSTARPRGQCDGQADAAYPGKGVNQHCAFGDIRYLWAEGEYTNDVGLPKWGWVGQGGDTYIIDCPRDCRIGYDGPDSGNYTNSAGYAVALAGDPYRSGAPVPPDGTPSRHTRILGKNYPSCADDALKAHINGGYGADPVFDLSDVQYVDLACFDITDHSSCTRTSVKPCRTSYPLDDYATSAIESSNTTNNVTLTDIRVHGMAANGFIGPTGDGVALERVALAGNAQSGWNMDKGDGMTGTGNLTLDHFQVLWNGCAEEYPIVDAQPYHYCTDDKSGGYGDGLSAATAQTNLAWHVTITNSVAAYNTQDGFDLLHLSGGGSTVTITNSMMYSNMGQQLTVGAASTTRNNLIVGNCNALRQPIPGTPAGYNERLSDFCSTADTALIIAVLDTAPTYFQFNTLYSANATGVEIICEAGPGKCTNRSTILYQGNVFLGFQNNAANGYPGGGNGDYANPIHFETSGLFSNAGTKFDHNSSYHAKSNWTCPKTGYNEANAVCANPQLRDPSWHLYGFGDMEPLATSPLIAAGISVAGLTTDFAGTARPGSPTIGALEVVSHRQAPTSPRP
jgi:hypothetical protein